jgi:hypothetical protein
MKFLIQHNLMNTDQLARIREVVERFPHQYVGLIPFSRELTSDQPVEGIDYIPYGSTLMSTVGLECGWKGLYLNLDTFNYRAAVNNRKDMLNDDLILSAEDVVYYMEHQTHGEDCDWFIRPSHDLKQFSGQVISAKDCVVWLKEAMQHDMSGSYKINKDTPIVVAEPKNIDAEWRWFIVGGEIIDGSMYRAHGQLIKQHETDPGVYREAQNLADGWLPAPCVVMDTALVNGELKVIEFNCINASGFYNHNVDLIFSSLYDHCSN